MTTSTFPEQVRNTWAKNNEITLELITAIPTKGFQVVPTGSRGRTVAEQLYHVHRVRMGWLHNHRTGQRPQLARAKDLKLSRAFSTQGF